jgi:AraC-like DNA-binding protein
MAGTPKQTMAATVAPLREAVLNDRDIDGRSGIRTRWWWPEPALADCVRAFIARDTTRASTLESPAKPGAPSPAPRAGGFSRFPATPACSLAWFFEGGDAHRSDGQPLPARIVFRGPFSRPALAHDAADLHVFLVMLLPDALARLSGVHPLDHVDRLSPAEAVFAADWAPLFASVSAAADDADRVRIVTDFLAPRWAQAQVANAGPLSMDAHDGAYDAWTRRLAQRAEIGGGRSIRQRERRLRAWTGQNAGELRRIARAERCFRLLLQACSAERAARPHWAELALAAGYADQPHMCREVRRVAGVSPQTLWRGIRHDPSFWVFRLWQGADAAQPATPG